MNPFRQLWNRFFPPVQSLPAGIHHLQSPADAPFPYRLHLRIEPDGHGILIVNASTIVHLNKTATEYAYHLVYNTPEDQAVKEIARRYNAPKEIILRDYHDLMEKLFSLVNTQDLDPVTFLDFNRQDPYSGAISAPYRLDCALTYHLPEEGAGHQAPHDRVSRELLSEEWKQILDKAWNAGVPQVIFTGGEPTLRPDLHDLITYAENLGMVSGLITNGLRLSETKYLHEILGSGLDYVMILLDPTEDSCWEAIRDVVAEDLSLTVHVTLTRHNAVQFDQLLDRLAEMGVPSVSLSTDTLELKDELQSKREVVAQRHMRLVWDLPAPYSHFHPVAVELAETIPDADLVSTGHGSAWLYVEPDGDVLPGQGLYQQVLGNLLTDSWEQVWQNAHQSSAANQAA